MGSAREVGEFELRIASVGHRLMKKAVNFDSLNAKPHDLCCNLFLLEIAARVRMIWSMIQAVQSAIAQMKATDDMEEELAVQAVELFSSGYWHTDYAETEKKDLVNVTDTLD